MLKQKLRIAQAKVLFRQLAIITLSIIIGATFMFSWIEGKKLFAEYDKAVILIERAEAKEVGGASRSSNLGDTPAIPVAGLAQASMPHNNDSSVASLIRQTFPEEPETMLQIANWESSLRPDAVNVNKNGTKDCGLMQVNSIHGYDCEWLKVPENNMIAARKIYDTQGKQAWVSYNFNKNL